MQTTFNIIARGIIILLAIICYFPLETYSTSDTLYFNYKFQRQSFHSNKAEEESGFGIMIKSKNKIEKIFCLNYNDGNPKYLYSIQDTIYYILKDSSYYKYQSNNITNFNFDMNFFKYYPVNFNCHKCNEIDGYNVCTNISQNKKNRFTKTYITNFDLSHIKYYDSILSSEVGNKFLYAEYLQIKNYDTIDFLREKLLLFNKHKPEYLGYTFSTIQDTRFEINIGDTLSNFEFMKLDSSIISFNDITTRLVVVDFWYSSCLPCIKLMKDIPEIKANFDTSITFIGINSIDKDFDKIRNAINFHNLLNGDYSNVWVDIQKEKFTKLYKIPVYPSILILNDNLVVLDIIMGYSELHKKRIIKKIKKFL